jgi:hypothetical protein
VHDSLACHEGLLCCTVRYMYHVVHRPGKWG